MAMINFFEKIILISYSIPLVFCSAMFFYVFLLIVVGNKSFRMKLYHIYELPIPSTKSHIASFDFFRGLAALWIASFHTWQWLRPFNDSIYSIFPIIGKGNKAVPLFVELSGLLVYRSLRGKCSSADEVLRYAKRRFLRIYPLFFCTIIVSLLLGYFPSDPTKIQRFLAEVFMLRTFNYHSFVSPVTWSLYVEVLFYICLPVFVIIVRKNVITISLLIFLVLSLIDSGQTRELSIIKYFFVGIAVAEILALSNNLEGLCQVRAFILFALGLILLFLDFWNKDVLGLLFKFVNIDLKLDSTYSFSVGISFALLLLSCIKFVPLVKIATSFPMRFLGVISYSLFMWHGFIVIANTGIFFDGMGSPKGHAVIADGGVGLFIGLYLPSFLLISALSYACIERPFLKLRPK
jgi:peptidoglycan/LPS O-acetylase OafA/YrhL